MNLLSKYLLFCQVGFHNVLAVMVGITLNVKSVILLSWLPVYWFKVARSQTMITFTSRRILILSFCLEFNLWDKIYTFLSFYGSGLVIILKKKNLPERKDTILLISIAFWNFRKKYFTKSIFALDMKTMREVIVNDFNINFMTRRWKFIGLTK